MKDSAYVYAHDRVIMQMIYITRVHSDVLMGPQFPPPVEEAYKRFKDECGIHIASTARCVAALKEMRIVQMAPRCDELMHEIETAGIV